MTLPSNFNLNIYQLTVQSLEPLNLPVFKGSALRGGFGITFKRLVCQYPSRCGEKCQLGNDCPYGYIFETTLPPDATVLRNFQNIPRPFIIQSPTNQRAGVPFGMNLIFRLVLIGQSNKYLPYFINVFRELGQVGLGKQRGRYRLLSVELIHPFERVIEPIYLADSELIRVPDLAITAESIAVYAANLGSNHLALNFLTPTRIKYRGEFIEQGPSFQAIVQNLLGRVSSLSYFHCGQKFEADFRGLIDKAAEVKIVESETRWQEWSRFSGRQKQRIEMGGLVGRVTYEGNLKEYLPLLALGELIHVGKGTVFGNGQYEIK